MEKSIVNRFTPDIVTEAAQRFGIGTADLTNMNGFQNFVYRGSRDGRDTIIRIAHESHRSEEQTLAEFEFIAYLSESGLYPNR